MSDISELFEDNDIEVDGIQLVEIDLDGINAEAKADAVALIDNLSKFYYDEDFMRRNPTFKKRVDTDLESLRILFKMRRADEEAHDLLIKAITGNSGNASLYKSLTEMQKTIISITSKIGDIIEGLNALMKGYQLELNFDDNKEEESVQDVTDNSSITHRGSKEFIQHMAHVAEQGDLFEDEKMEGE
jgi:hypothetical protein